MAAITPLSIKVIGQSEKYKHNKWLIRNNNLSRCFCKSFRVSFGVNNRRVRATGNAGAVHIPDTADRPQDRAAQPLVRRSGLSAAWARRHRGRHDTEFVPPNSVRRCALNRRDAEEARHRPAGHPGARRAGGGDAACGAGRRPDAWRGAARDHGDGAGDGQRIMGRWPPSGSGIRGTSRDLGGSRQDQIRLRAAGRGKSFAVGGVLNRSTRSPGARRQSPGRARPRCCAPPRSAAVPLRENRRRRRPARRAAAARNRRRRRAWWLFTALEKTILCPIMALEPATKTTRSKQCDRSNAGRGRER
jgi:hypothetical protein